MNRLAERKKLPVDSDSEDDEEEKCEHEGVETEEDFVCCKCGLVLSSIYQPDVHWHEHAVLDRQYTDSDRLVAVDKNLVKFMEKANLHRSLPLVVMQERLRAMKISSGYKNLNYAIALTCILAEDKEARDKIAPFLPKSNVAWARSARLLHPAPMQFVDSWLRNLRRRCPSKDLSKTQKKRFYDSLKLLDETERQTMYNLMHCYGRVHFYGLDETNDLDVLPIELRHALYRYLLAVCKPPVKRKRQ